jgi:hypothetical protein
VHELVADSPLEFAQPPMHGRLAQPQSLARRNRAAMARNRQEIGEVIPVEHGRDYAILTPLVAILRLPRPALTDLRFAGFDSHMGDLNMRLGYALGPALAGVALSATALAQDHGVHGLARPNLVLEQVVGRAADAMPGNRSAF